MEFEAFLLNTVPNTERWHLDATASLTSYFANHDIKLNILSSDNHLIKQIGDNDNLTPLLRKIFRLYRFLETDAQYGIFVDLDTAVINKHVDIRGCIEDGFNYINHSIYQSDEDELSNFAKTQMSLSLDKRTWTLARKPFLHEVAFKEVGITPKRRLNLDTGFSIFNRSVCEKVISRMDEYGINPLTTAGKKRINFLQEEWRRQIIASELNPGLTKFHDEHIIELTLADDWEDSNFKQSSSICGSPWQVGGGDLNLRQFSENEFIFFHFMASAKGGMATYSRMFR